MIKGYDWASEDGNRVDYTKMVGSFVIVRGVYVYQRVCLSDGDMPRHRDIARIAGKRFGSYLILNWDANGPTPETQAQTFIRAFGIRRDGELPPFLDLEADNASAVGRTPAQCLEWAHRAYDVLAAFYVIVGVYTSSRVWLEVFGGQASRMGNGPLWIKVPYPYNVHEVPHDEACPTMFPLPSPWRDSSSPGAWIVQYQGDSRPVPGFSSTVDLDAWIAPTGATSMPWILQQLAKFGTQTVQEFQATHGLQADGIIGPSTFCALARSLM